jgi:hypothetical protein
LWYADQAECEAALPKWRTSCLSCAISNQPIVCPMTFSGSPSPGRQDSHGLFLAWVDTDVPTMAKNTGWAGGTPSPSSGLPGDVQKAIGPRQCNLTAHAMRVDPDTGDKTLVMTMTHRPTSLRFHVAATLAGCRNDDNIHDAGALNLTLEVELPSTHAKSLRPSNITIAFPYITGIAIGGDGSTNAGINHFGTGLATDGTLRAWVPSGGLYGWQTSHTWSSVWEPSTGAGFSLIIMDKAVLNETHKQQRVIMRFPDPNTNATAPSSGGVYALSYPATALDSGGARVKPSPDVQLFVHDGGWRVAAKQYGRWLRNGLAVTHRGAPSWLDEVMSKDSAWVPDSAGVDAAKKTGIGLTSFEDLYENHYASNTVDMFEFAMWWEGVECRTKQGEPLPDWTCGYGAFGADGVFQPRQDLGGIEALRKGVEKIHKMNRRIQLYVSSDIVQINNSTFFNESWPWQRWADWPTAQAPVFPHSNYNASTLCHAFRAWQEQVALFTSRVIAETGVDGVRLDGLGGQFAPCENPSHHHESIFENQGTAANVQMARLTREAMDGVQGGDQSILSSEGYQDIFHPFTSMSLVMWYPGRDIDAMRVALPEYRAAAYSPDAGAIETALNGWMASGSDRALRTTWPYGSKCGAPPLSGFPSTPCNYPLDGGRPTRWSELRPTFVLSEGQGLGELSTTDPIAVGDDEFVTRLYVSNSYSLLLVARWNGSTPTQPTTVMLPTDAQAADALNGVTHGVEVNAYTLASSPVTVGNSSVTIGQSGFSVVLLPKTSCPALLALTPTTVPTLDKSGANSTSLQLTMQAPWQASHGTQMATTVTVDAPGLELSASTISVPGTLTLRVAKADKPLTRPHYFMLTLRGEGFLGTTRRWVHAV